LSEYALDHSSIRSFFATTGKGMEQVLADELQKLGIAGIVTETGGVRFEGPMIDAWRANLWLRTANRVLMPLAEFLCDSGESLYQGLRALPWHDYLNPDMTLAVDCNLRDSSLTHSGFAALKAKDAIVDSLRDRFGRRPNVAPRDPDLRVNLHVAKNRCTVSLDTSGGSLHQRGYRRERAEAPLKETLAAALIELTDWDGSIPLLDPMCGSGTIPIEAALKASGRPPGLERQDFGFQRWPGFRPDVWQGLVEEARGQILDTLPAPIIGSDISPAALAMARKNAAWAGVGRLITLNRADIRSLAPPPGPGILLFNPPYGARLGEIEQLKSLYRQIGDAMKQNAAGYTAYLFSGNPQLAKFVGLKASRRIVLFNGPIECRLLRYELY
jgi:putative N6-adenine-specific DNA methylase